MLVQLAFVTTTSESFRQIKLWIDYHKSIGVNHFYLFVDGQVRLAYVASCYTLHGLMPPLQSGASTSACSSSVLRGACLCRRPALMCLPG